MPLAMQLAVFSEATQTPMAKPSGIEKSTAILEQKKARLNKTQLPLKHLDSKNTIRTRLRYLPDSIYQSR